ncbi:MAG TPA: TIGR03435 family protein [Bryobacteraceae bacterium]
MIRATFLVALIAVSAFGQSPANRRPHFDAATLKADDGPTVFGSTGAMRGGPGTADPGHVTIKQRNLKTLIWNAYGLGLDRIYGPASIGDADNRYTIDATMPAATTHEEFQQMLQNLLEEHLHLAVHHETKDFPGYDLTVSPAGVKVKEFVADPNAPRVRGVVDAHHFRSISGSTGYVTTSAGVINKLGVFRVSSRLTMQDFAKHLGTLINFSEALPAGVETPQVTDKTGLTGVYDLRLMFAGTSILPGATPSSDSESEPTIDVPNLFAALEKQFGLRLVKAKAVPVNVLVVDHADKAPSGN